MSRRPVEMFLADGPSASATEFERRAGIDALHDPLVGAAFAAWVLAAHGEVMREEVGWMRKFRELPPLPPDPAGVETTGFGPLWSLVPEVLYARDLAVRVEDLRALVDALLPLIAAWDRGPTPGSPTDVSARAFVLTLTWLWPRDRVVLEPALVALAARARDLQPDVRAGGTYRDRWKRAWTSAGGIRPTDPVPETRMIRYLRETYGSRAAEALLDPRFADEARARDEAFRARFRSAPPPASEDLAAHALGAWGPSFVTWLRVAPTEVRAEWLARIREVEP